MADVKTDMTIRRWRADISRLKDAYPFLDIVAAGKSVLGRNIYCIKLGYGPSEVFYNGAAPFKRMDNFYAAYAVCKEFMRAYSEGLENA